MVWARRGTVTSAGCGVIDGVCWGLEALADDKLLAIEGALEIRDDIAAICATLFRGTGAVIGGCIGIGCAGIGRPRGGLNVCHAGRKVGLLLLSISATPC